MAYNGNTIDLIPYNSPVPSGKGPYENNVYVVNLTAESAAEVSQPRDIHGEKPRIIPLPTKPSTISPQAKDSKS